MSITNSETWSGTVHLTGDVTVTPIGNLTILPGTRIEADPRADDQIGGIHTSRIELIVDQGTLVAVGTPTSPILFTAAMLGTNTSQPGDWYGVRINSTNATLRDCTVEYAMNGLDIEGGTPNVDYCSFRQSQYNGVHLKFSAVLSNCTINNNKDGIWVDGGRTLLLSDSTISNQWDSGVVAHGIVSVTRCTITYNAIDGIGAQIYEGAQSPLLNVLGSIISHNGELGVEGAGVVNVNDSVIEANGQEGILAGTSGTVMVSNTVVRGNGGVFARNGISCPRATVIGSIIMGNGVHGIESATVDIRNNVIAANLQCGINLWEWPGSGRPPLTIIALTNNEVWGNARDQGEILRNTA